MHKDYIDRNITIFNDIGTEKMKIQSQNRNNKKKYSPLPRALLAGLMLTIILMIITACAMGPELETLEIEAANNLPMNVNSNQPMILKPIPEDADSSNITFVSSDESVVTVSNEEGGATITSHDVGTASVYAVSENGVTSNSVDIKVINELAERKKAQEQKEKRRQTALKQKEKQETKTAQTRQRTTTDAKPGAKTSYESTSQEYKEGYVYIPRTGHRYHKDSICSGMRDLSYVPLSTAKKRGFTPCKKCYGYY